MVEFPKKYTPIDQKSQSAPFPLFPEVQGKKNTLAYSAFMPPYRIDLGISSDHIFSLLTEDVLVRFHEMLGKETFFPEISYTYTP
jgi:valyl-tRNA synthetase